MKLIVAVDKNWAIGLGRKLMWSIPADMKFFRARPHRGMWSLWDVRPWKCFPEGQPLPNRVNIVIATDGYQVTGAVVVHSVEELKES